MNEELMKKWDITQYFDMKRINRFYEICNGISLGSTTIWRKMKGKGRQYKALVEV